MRTILSVAFLVALGVVFLPSTSPANPVEPPPPPVEDDKLPLPPSAEKLAAIKAPPPKLVHETKSGYKITVDLSQQILSIHNRKQEDWISPGVAKHQTVEVVLEGAPLSRGSTTLAKLKKGRVLYASGEQGDWVQVQLLENGEPLRGWVLKRHLITRGTAQVPSPRLRGQEYASAAMLIQKGKQFDDGLYAAVEYAMQNGLGPVKGKRDWVPALAARVDTNTGGKPLAILFAATQLSGNKTQLPAPLAQLRDAELKEFLADEKRSKPLGFYTWTPELETIFRQDRMLQTAYDAQENSQAVIAVARALAADAAARRSYETAFQLNARLTNQPAVAGYDKVLAALDAGQTPQFEPQTNISFLPPSRSHETDLGKKLYANRPIPAGFDLMNEVIRRLKSGELSFEPQENSGWYDHQLYALETLIRFDTAPESRRLQPNDEYRKHLEELFKGTYALTRETHIKQLEIAPLAAAAEPPPVQEREKVYFRPAAQVEYLPTMYLRRASSYRFVRGVLEETFGAENVKLLKRQTATGPVEMNLADELVQMEQLFRGAYVVACREIGMPEATTAAAVAEGDAPAAAFLRWVASLRSDRDLTSDARMMVPVFYDLQRQKLKVWVMLGWESASTTIGYARHPGVTILDPAGKPVPGNHGPEVIFENAYRNPATPVFAEVYVTKLLNRTEFRRHCNTYQTKQAILANLE